MKPKAILYVEFSPVLGTWRSLGRSKLNHIDLAWNARPWHSRPCTLWLFGMGGGPPPPREDDDGSH